MTGDGYFWARTPKGELFVVLVVSGQGYVAAVECAIDLVQIDILEPVAWPTASAAPNQSSDRTKHGLHVVGAMLA